MIRISISCTLSFNTCSDARSCLFRAVTGIIKAEEKIMCSAASLELSQSDLTPERQNGVYVFVFRKKMDVIWRLCFISIVTKHSKDYCDLLDGMRATMLHSFIN